MPTIRSSSAEQTQNLGERIASSLRGNNVIALHAPLGAGKTVLAKGIARGLGVTDIVTSPTYTIISEYSGRFLFIHVDLYRIGSEEEYDQLALTELMNQDAVVVIEWPERAVGPVTPVLTQVRVATSYSQVSSFKPPASVPPKSITLSFAES